MIVATAFNKKDLASSLIHSATESALQGNGQKGMSIAVAAAVWPYQGFGNKFLTGSISTGTGWGTFGVELVGNSPLCTYTATFDSSDLSFTYRTLEFRTDFSDGSWQKETHTYQTYWINGYGASTEVSSSIVYSSPMPPAGMILYNSFTSVAVSDTKISVTANITIFSQDSPPANYDVTQSVNLTDAVLYSDVVLATKVGLTSLSYPAFPDSGTSFGAYQLDIIWPSSPISNTTTTSAVRDYFICAAHGVLSADGRTIDGGTLAYTDGPPYSSLGGSTQSIVSAKSKWLLKDVGFYGPGYLPYKPFSLYYFPLDPTTFVAGSVVDLSVTEDPSGWVYTFDLTAIPGFVTPPYTGGFGELGFNSTRR